MSESVVLPDGRNTRFSSSLVKHIAVLLWRIWLITPSFAIDCALCDPMVLFSCVSVEFRLSALVYLAYFIILAFKHRASLIVSFLQMTERCLLVDALLTDITATYIIISLPTFKITLYICPVDRYEGLRHVTLRLSGGRNDSFFFWQADKRKRERIAENPPEVHETAFFVTMKSFTAIKDLILSMFYECLYVYEKTEHGNNIVCVYSEQGL